MAFSLSCPSNPALCSLMHLIGDILSYSTGRVLSLCLIRDVTEPAEIRLCWIRITGCAATGQVIGRWRILTPYRIKTHEPTATKFRTIEWEDTLNQIWYISIHWGLLGIWVKYNVFVLFYLFIYTFFSETRVQVRPVDGFLRAIAH